MRACLLLLILRSAILSEGMKESVFRRDVGSHLVNHVFRAERAKSESECGMYCLRYSTCFSVNYKIGGVVKGLCELNSKPTEKRNEKEHNPEYIYLEKVRKTEINSM